MTAAKPWSDDEVEVLREVWPKLCKREVATLMRRTECSVQRKAAKLGILRGRGRRPGDGGLLERIRRALARAGSAGLDMDGIKALAEDRPHSASTSITGLVRSGHAFAGGPKSSRKWRRYFSTAAHAAAWERALATQQRARATALAPTLIVLGASKGSTRGPFEPDAAVTYHPQFRFTRAPTPPQPLRTNTYSIY